MIKKNCRSRNNSLADYSRTRCKPLGRHEVWYLQPGRCKPLGTSIRWYVVFYSLFEQTTTSFLMRELHLPYPAGQERQKYGRSLKMNFQYFRGRQKGRVKSKTICPWSRVSTSEEKERRFKKMQECKSWRHNPVLGIT